MPTRPHATAAPQEPSLRADARRNRGRVLEAADAVFAEVGPGASTEDVARRAGVAVGTVFRHFPTKAALIEAVVVGRLAQLTDDAKRLGAAADAGAAVTTFVQRWIELSATKHQFASALAQSGTDVQEIRSTRPDVVEDLEDAVAVLLSRAQHVRAIREDLTTTDLMALMVGASHAHEHIGPDAARRARILSVLMDGLRPR